MHKEFCANCYILNNSTSFKLIFKHSFWYFFFDAMLRKSTFQHFNTLYYYDYNK
nr:hypothetical protein QQAWYXWE_QQAWYXWE_CDS_0013 [Microvirus sp.]